MAERPDGEQLSAVVTETGLQLAGFYFNETLLGPVAPEATTYEVYEVLPPAGTIAEIVLGPEFYITGGAGSGKHSVSIFMAAYPVMTGLLHVEIAPAGTWEFYCGEFKQTPGALDSPLSSAAVREMWRGLRFSEEHPLCLGLQNMVPSVGGDVPLEVQMMIIAQLRQVG